MRRMFAMILSVLLLVSAAACSADNSGHPTDGSNTSTGEGSQLTDASNSPSGDGGIVSVPDELAEIPDDYYSAAEEKGTLVELYYDTCESMTYEQKTTPLQMRAIVYLPYGYTDETEYADDTVEIANCMKSHASAGETIPVNKDTGLFFFRGNAGAPFAVCNAGGGFACVGAMHDSFPHALELSKKGYNAFALIHRPGATTAGEDLAWAISFICAGTGESHRFPGIHGRWLSPYPWHHEIWVADAVEVAVPAVIRKNSDTQK